MVLEAEPQRISVAFAIDDSGLKPGDQRPTVAKIVFQNNRISVAEPSKVQIAQTAGLLLVSLESRYSVGELLLKDNVFSLPPGREMIISPSAVVRSFLQQGNVDSNKTKVRVRDEHGNPVNSL